MRSHIDHPTAGHAADPLGENFALSVSDIHRQAQQHRAMVIGSLIADGIVWLMRAPARFAAWLTASATHHLAPWRS